MIKALHEQRPPGPRGYKTFLCSTQLGMKFILLLNVKIPTIVGILTLMSRGMIFPTVWYLRPANAQTSLRIRAV